MIETIGCAIHKARFDHRSSALIDGDALTVLRLSGAGFLL